MNIILLDDSNAEEQNDDDSIVFISESTATLEMKKQNELNKKMFKLRQENRKLKNRVQQLSVLANKVMPNQQATGDDDDDDVMIVEPQKSRDLDNTEPTQNDNESQVADDDDDGDAMIVEPQELNSMKMDFNVSYDEAFINEELDHWHTNGELPNMLDEFQQYMNNLN